MSKGEVRIDILGTELSISTDEEQEYLDKLLTKYRKTIENVQQKTGLKDPLRVAILTGFLLCDDLEKSGPKEQKPESGSIEKPGSVPTSREIPNVEDDGEAERLALSMISRLDELICDFKPGDSSCDISSLPLPPDINKEPKHAIYKLRNTVKNYAWGSAEWIPALLGQKNISRIPWAELWMGVHPLGASRVIIPDALHDESGNDEQEQFILLSELIEQDKETFLGKETARDTLPFLLKLLAAAKPLSIQVHPNKDQAREGFERENQKGIPLDAPERSYKDKCQKSEILCALGPFMALCGFREAVETGFIIELIAQVSEGRLKSDLENLILALAHEKAPIKTFLSVLFGMESEAFKTLGLFLKENQESLAAEFPEYSDVWKLCVYLAGLFPGDCGILAPAYLNIVELDSGEAIYLPAGVMHTYIRGLAVELMTNSDNVLRGGLSSKFVDKDELLEIIDFSEYKPGILKAPSPSPAIFSYPPLPIEEFVLSVIHCSESLSYSTKSPVILIITEGSAAVTDSEKLTLNIKTGESFFIPPDRSLEFSGNFTAYSASIKAD